MSISTVGKLTEIKQQPCLHPYDRIIYTVSNQMKLIIWKN